MSKRMVALLLALVMLLGLLPAGALAAEPESGSLGTVRVIVENTTAEKGQDLGTVFQQHGKTLARLQALGRQPLRHLQRLLRQRAGGAAAALFGQNYHHPVGGRLGAAKEVLHACHPWFCRRMAGMALRQELRNACLTNHILSRILSAITSTKYGENTALSRY